MFTLPACNDILGLSTGSVLDNMMSASSALDAIYTPAGRARVNRTESKTPIFYNSDNKFISFKYE